MSPLPFDFKRDQLLNELAEFQANLVRGYDTLAKIDHIDVGVTPRQEVYSEGKLKLYRYTPFVTNPHPVPLLIVFALVNRPYMVDLQENRSLVRGLLEAGMDVYLIDWGYADRSDRTRTLDDYINGFMSRCVQHIPQCHELDAINLLGICQGGTFSLCFNALHPQWVRNLVTMVTPVDFHTDDNLLTHLVREVDMDRLVNTLGNVPGELLNWLFLALRPFRLTGQKYVELLDVVGDKEKALNFMRMEKWIFDSPDQAGETLRQFVKTFFQQNGFVNGTVKIGEHGVDLRAIKNPLLNIYATEDHLVPPAASLALKNLVASEDYSALAFRGGHIGIYVGGRAKKEIPPAIASWLRER